MKYSPIYDLSMKYGHLNTHTHTQKMSDLYNAKRNARYVDTNASTANPCAR